MRSNLLIGCSVTCLLIGYLGAVYQKNAQISDIKENHKKQFKYWDSKVGSTRLTKVADKKYELGEEMVSYNLRSFDGGQNWYQVEYDTSTDPWKMKILGNVQETNPGLLASIGIFESINAIGKGD